MPIFCLFNWWRWKGKSSLNLVIVCKYSNISSAWYKQSNRECDKIQQEYAWRWIFTFDFICKMKNGEKGFCNFFIVNSLLKQKISFELWFEIEMYKNTKIILYALIDLQICPIWRSETNQTGRTSDLCKPVPPNQCQFKKVENGF